MELCKIATFIVIAAALLVPTVAAQGTGSHNYIVTPAGDTMLEDGPVFMPMNVGSITQGETDWYSLNVAAGTTKLTIDLNWGDSSDSLRLTVYAPDTVLGPYYDSYDGTTNGRIYMSIEDSVGLYPGTWWFEVYGADVDGTEDYTFGWR
ncbi:pre-peptidase C-terminal domain-containing protein [Methanoculleus sp. 10]|uniref:pre-peptidase C-terminal domain-containing protein n=1 Tax=Methanoculleus sp. 10 TaxID=430615 RepID=UPI0025F39FEE|nr:pre-peptidase C-terminal domain-containing protein [Methanoculleus sp. 10]